jgi:hypothetical protein
VAGDEEAATGEKEEGDKKRTNCFYVGGSGGQLPPNNSIKTYETFISGAPH